MKKKKLKEAYLDLLTYEAVNKIETPEGIYEAIRNLAEDGAIQGRSRKFDADNMIIMAQKYFEDECSPNYITRQYGLRQQAMYIKYYLRSKSDEIYLHNHNVIVKPYEPKIK